MSGFEIQEFLRASGSPMIGPYLMLDPRDQSWKDRECFVTREKQPSPARPGRRKARRLKERGY